MAAYRWTHVTCMLTAKNRDQLWNPTLGNRVWATFTFFTRTYIRVYTMYYIAHGGPEDKITLQL